VEYEIAGLEIGDSCVFNGYNFKVSGSYVQCFIVVDARWLAFSQSHYY